MAKTYDAIVVGARVAGSPTAMLLARKGYDVLLVDRASFPSDTISTHLSPSAGHQRAAALGIAGQGCCQWVSRRRHLRASTSARSHSRERPTRTATVAYGPRRTVLDKLLLDAAGRSGRRGARRLQRRNPSFCEDDQVIGVRGHGKGGTTVTERARVVIGADGRHSLGGAGGRPHRSTTRSHRCLPPTTPTGAACRCDGRIRNLRTPQPAAWRRGRPTMT